MGGRRDQGVPAQCQASSLLPDISDACVLLAPGCLGWVIGTWQRPAPLLCCVLVHFQKQRQGHSDRGVFEAACRPSEQGICLYKRFPCCQHLTRCSQTCVIVGSVMMIICIFNVQTALKRKPRLNLLGADLNAFSLSWRSPRE